ncbi:DUF4055 domain-containing protein [Brevundimonas vesicularis]|uniref:DUF4055 domain-containing protein n=1 Tax=Brevundimonas vesicularis TaxID=41276 RepID=UPI00384E5826
MPVNDRDPAWAEHQGDRKKVADIFAGRECAVGYIRGLPGWDVATLQNIQEGAYFLPMVARTVETFGGLVFMKAPSRTLPAGLEPYLKDVTQSGQEVDRFAEQTLDAVMLSGAVMVLVDYPSSSERVTRARAEEMGRRPVLRLYDGNAILAARTMQVGAARKLSHVRLLEQVQEEDPQDRFKLVEIEQVRVLDLVDGSYVQTVWRAKDGQWSAIETVTPTMNAKALDAIPAFFSNTRDGEPVPAKPPLTDLADINVAHLNNAAQYEWALAWLGAPVLFGAGISLNEGETIQMGASSAVITGEANAKLEIVQADAAKFSGLKTAMDDKRRDAAALGARMLMESPRAAIAAETARIERAGETSVVGAMANAVSQCLTNALTFMAQWAGVSGDVLYWLNTDLLPAGMDPQQLEALLKAWQSGAISKRELFAKLQQGEIVDPAKSYEDHEEEVAEEGAAPGLVEEDEAPPEAA